MQELEFIKLKFHDLEQENADLILQLETAIQHGDLIDEELIGINARLLKEVEERRKAEQTLRLLTVKIQKDKDDLELVVQTVTEHSDKMDEQFIEAKTLAMTDSLTGIANRRHFDQYLAEECMRASRHGYGVALAMIDIDHFKLYNDCYGHVEGDQCLQKIAEALSCACKRSTDFVARYGGEEFVIIISGMDAERAEITANVLHRAVARACIPHRDSPTAKHITISMGLTMTQPGLILQGTEIVKFADKLLYEAKHNGRNQTKVAAFESNSSGI